jgi:hypothetical protein
MIPLMNMQYNVGQTITIPSDEILGSEEEPVEVLEWGGDPDSPRILVRQLTDINGEPGEFWVDVESLVAIVDL